MKMNPLEHKDFPIVGIGASAGGLEALQQFFKAMPPAECLNVIDTFRGRLREGVTPSCCKVASSVAPLIGLPLSECKTN